MRASAYCPARVEASFDSRAASSGLVPAIMSAFSTAFAGIGLRPAAAAASRSRSDSDFASWCPGEPEQAAVSTSVAVAISP